MIQVHKSGEDDEEEEDEYENIDDFDDGFIANGNGPYDGDIGEDIEFFGDYIDNDGGTTSIKSWFWEFGDGSTSDEQNPTYAYTTDGDYTVNLTVTNNTDVYDWYLTTAIIGEEDDISDSGWYNIEENSQIFDLIALENIEEDLGLEDLPVGKYTQIRLTIEEANIKIDNDGDIKVYDLKIPSNKIKLIKPFYIYEDDTTTLILDFDAKESVHKTGNNKYIMRPTIKVIEG
jgi:PKD repeat protein